MTQATLDGVSVTRARVQIPSWGVWWADVELAEPEDLSGSVELVLADLTLTGTIVVGGVSRGRAGYRIAGGAGGWGTTIASKAYGNDLGVKESTVAQDAATDAGETIDLSGLTGRVGPHYVREEGPGSKVLDQVAPQTWYVGLDGTTYTAARTTSTVTIDARRVRVDQGVGVIVLAASELSDLLPGATVDGLTAVDVQHDLDAETGLRTTLYGSPWGYSRRVEALRRLIRQLLPEYKWRGVYEYRIGQQSGERLSVQPIRTSAGLPSISRVKVRPGIPGARAEHTLGSQVLVSFIDGDPARPVVIGFDDAESDGFIPDQLDLCEAEGCVVREGDTIALTDSSTGAITITVGAGGEKSKVFA